MAELSITHNFVRALTKGIRTKYGTEPKHTEVLDLVAEAIGWQTDALMHKLKNPGAETPAGFEAPNSIDDETLVAWVTRRRWRNVETEGLGILAKAMGENPPEELNGVDRGLLGACVSLCRIVLNDADGAKKVIAALDSGNARFLFARAIVAYETNGPSMETAELLERAMRAEPGLIKHMTFPRDPDIGDDAFALAFGDLSARHLETCFDDLLDHLPVPAFCGYVRKVACEAKIPGAMTPAVRIEDSVHDDGIVCLFDGVKRAMLHRHLRSKYRMTPDEYRSFWELPDDYPLVAPHYDKEKRLAAFARSLVPDQEG